MEGDRTNLLNCRGDKGTKIHDFNDVVSSLKPLDYVRQFVNQKDYNMLLALSFK